MNQYDYEDAKVDCLNAAASCLRGVCHALPYFFILYAFGYLMQSALSMPYTLTCETKPAEKPEYHLKMSEPQAAPTTEDMPSVEVPASNIQANPVRQD